jgi:hypothetical protein
LAFSGQGNWLSARPAHTTTHHREAPPTRAIFFSILDDLSRVRAVEHALQPHTFNGLIASTHKIRS